MNFREYSKEQYTKLQVVITYALFFQSNKECSHVWAATRDEGTQIWWDNCDLSNKTMVDHKCNVVEDLEELNCKLYPT